MKEEFLKIFKLSPNSDNFIRKEIFIDDKKRKVVAFGIACLDVATGQQYKNYLERSNEILKKEKNNFDKNLTLYKWSGSDFCKEDNNKQSWFKQT